MADTTDTIRDSEFQRSYKVNDPVRVRYGCVWFFGEIDGIKDNDYYEVSYGTKKQWERHKYGYPLNYFADVHITDLKFNN